VTSNAPPARRLAIYLNDHLAGSALGVELARRVSASNKDDAEMGEPLAELRSEVEADRETLVALMKRLEIRRDPLKPAGAWIAEKLGRLKPNGQLTGYSPLSRLLELEMLTIGIVGKLQMWGALAGTVGPRVGEFDLAELSRRAARQRDAAEEMHRIAASRALPGQASKSGSVSLDSTSSASP
jgi:hypothetical protein